MSKAIFIMEMPKRCSECRFCLQVKQKNGLALCLAIDDSKPTKYNPKRESEWLPDWCPLKPVPSKLDLKVAMQESIKCDCYDEENPMDYAYLEGNVNGWNNCVDKITGEDTNEQNNIS